MEINGTSAIIFVLLLFPSAIVYELVVGGSRGWGFGDRAAEVILIQVTFLFGDFLEVVIITWFGFWF